MGHQREIRDGPRRSIVYGKRDRVRCAVVLEVNASCDGLLQFVVADGAALTSKRGSMRPRGRVPPNGGENTVHERERNAREASPTRTALTCGEQS